MKELESVLKNNKNKSPGPERIPNRLLLELPTSVKKYLLDLYNCIWIKQVFPNQWRNALVIAIPKQGKDKNKPETYARINPSRPFSHTGLDYTGFLFKASNRREVTSTKGYLDIFVCLYTKAIHIEVVGDLTTASFLAALRRFSSRQGTPAELWSDNTTTFHGADAALRSMFKEARHDQLQIPSDLANRGIRWRFIPPAASHFGGLWEAAVKSAKRHLKKVVGQRLLTYEERLIYR